MKRILLGHLAVDSGGIILADPATLGSFDKNTKADLSDLLPKGCATLNDMHEYASPELPWSLDAAWVARCSRDRGGILGKQRGGPGESFGDGIAVSTGYGDGIYPVYALITEPDDVEDDFSNGRVMAIIVDCEVPLTPPVPRRPRGQGLRELADAARTLLNPKLKLRPSPGAA